MAREKANKRCGSESSLYAGDLECGFIAAERNRYFTGKFLTARDFRDEQEYFISRDRFHHRVFHGWGIVCGLRITPHTNPDCDDGWVIVGPGIALDCCGRVLVLRKETAVRIWDPSAVSQQGDAQQQKTPVEEAETRDYLLFIRYVEKAIEKTPVLYDEKNCDPKHLEANRILECVELGVCLLDEVDAGCWSLPGGDDEARCLDDCDDALPGPAGPCLEPECPCGEFVPLAVIRPRKTNGGYVIEAPDIDTRGRRHLPAPPEFLTHIVGVNWPHGGEVSLSALRDEMQGKLKVRFDRKLFEADGDATGINAYTFVVQYGGVQQQVEFLPFDLDHPPGVEDDCTAVFTIDEDYTSPKGRFSLANNVVYVTLKCDFILDCHEKPVDGNHLRGRLPSGNGTPGGVFESWFRVVPDARTKEAQQ